MQKRKRARAQHGQKTIELTVRFWTNNISRKAGFIVKKECWDTGVVYLHKNEAHGVAGDKNPLPFNSLMELPARIERALMRDGIKLHMGDRSSKYMKG